MKLNILRNILLCLAFFSGMAQMKATHMVGGEITYKYLGRDTFEITLTLRRDCELGAADAQFDDPANISIYDGLTRRVRVDIGDLGLIRIPYSDDDTLNTFIRSECGFEGKQVCVHETKYKAKIRLPYTTRGYYVVYERCCRNSSLNNVVDPLETGSTYHVRIDRLPENQTNSTPVFSQWPDIYICKDKPLDFDHSAVDPDGDSLVYKLWNPFYGRTKDSPELYQPYSRLPEFVPVQFLEGYGVQNFFGGTPLQIDPRTGKLTGTPDVVGQFLVGVEVQEYRNGQYLGSVYRDFQYNVRICAAPPVADFDFPGDCKSLDVTFENKSTAAGRYEWNLNYPSDDPQYFSSDTNPRFVYPISGVYQVQLTAIRGSDECRTSIIRQVPAFNIDYLADFEYQTLDCGVGDSISLRLIDKSQISDNRFLTQDVTWTVTQNEISRVFSGLIVDIKVVQGIDIEVVQNVVANNLCSASLSRTIPASDLVVMADFDLSNVSCEDDESVNIALQDLSIYKGSNDLVESRTWVITASTGESFTSNEKTFEVKVPRSNLTIQLIVTANGCSDTLTRTIPASELFPRIDFKTSLNECRDSSVLIMFVPNVVNMSQSVTITSLEWDFNGLKSTADSVEYEIVGDEILIVTLKATLSNGCEVNTTKAYNAAAFRPIAGLNVFPIECPDNDLVTYQAVYLGTLGYNEINWTAGLISNQLNLSGNEIQFTIPKDSAYFVSVLGVYGKGCDAMASKSGDGGNFATIEFIANPLELCVGETSHLIVNPNPDYTYVWSPTAGLDLTNQHDPIVTGISNTRYVVKVSDAVCSVTDSIDVLVSDSLVLEIIGNTISCDGEYHLKASGGKNKGAYIWSLNADFTEIIFTGDSLDYTTTEREVQIYVTIQSDICKVVPASVNLKNATPFVIKDSISNYCVGDTFTFNLTSGNADVFKTIWASDSHIISSLDSNSIVIATSAQDVGGIVLYFTSSNEFGCEFTDSLVLTPSVRPVVDFTYVRNDCNNTEVCFTITGDPIGQFKWDFGMAGDDDVSSMASPCFVYPGFGLYQVTLQSEEDICGFNTISKPVFVSNTLDLIAQDDIVLCLNDTATLRVETDLPELSIMWLDEAGNLINVGNHYQFVPTVDVKFYLKAVDGGGCQYLDSLNVLINKDFPPILGDGSFTVCRGDSAALSVFDGNLESYEFTWFASPYIVGALRDANPVISIGADAPDNIFLAYRLVNKDGCIKQGEIKLNVNPVNEIQLNFTKADCNGNEVCFQIVGDYSGIVSWDFGDGTILDGDINQCHTYTNTGIFTVKALSTTSFCGFGESNRSVIVGGIADLIGEDEILLCSADTATISVKSNVSDLDIIWLDEAGNEVSLGPVYTFVPEDNTRLILKATDAANCTYFDTVAIRLNNNFPMLSVEGPFVVCEGDTAILPAFVQDVSGYDIVWGQNQYIFGDLQVANPMVGFGGAEEGDVTLNFTVKNAEGCIQQGAAPLVIRTKPTGDFEFNLDNCEDKRVCFSTAIDERVGIRWDFGNLDADGDTSLNSSVCYAYPASGVFKVTLETTGDFCTLPRIEKDITLYKLDDIIGTNIFNVCLRDTFQTVVLNEVPEDFEINWYDGTDLVGQGRELSFQVLGSRMLTVVATDPNGCEYTDSVMLIGINEFPTLEYLNVFPACLGDTVRISMINANPNHVVTILWDEDPHFVGPRDILTPMVGIEADEMSPFYLYFTATTQFGCTLRDSIYFTPGTPNVVSIDHVARDCDNFDVCFNIVGDYSGLVIWDFGDPNKPSGNVSGQEACFTYSGPGTYTVTIRNISAFCSFENTTKTIVLRDSLVIFEDPTLTICKGESRQISAPMGVANMKYEWFDMAGTSLGANRPVTVLGDQDKSIRLLVTDDNGCPFDDTLALSVFEPAYTIEMPDVYCQDVEAAVSIIFTGSNAEDYNFSWTPLDAIISGADTQSPMVNVTTARDLFVDFEHKVFGCHTRDTVSVVPFTFQISATASPDTVVDLLEEVELMVINPGTGWTYEWSNGATTQTQTVIAEGDATYTVTVTDANGCTAETQVSIRVNPPDCEEDVFIPTAFSPNQDGNNDVLYVRSNYIDEMELIIFNRWGQEVFTSNNINNGWDGTYKGKELSSDAFAYYLRVRCIDGNTITRRGNISLLR